MIYKLMTYKLKTEDKDGNEGFIQVRFNPKGTFLSDMDGNPVEFTDEERREIIVNGNTYRMSLIGYFDITSVSELLGKDYLKTKKKLLIKALNAGADWAKEAAEKELKQFNDNAAEGRLPV